MNQQISTNPEFPNIIYRRGASGVLSPILLGTGIRVQTIVIAFENNTPLEIAEDYGLSEEQVHEALRFYEVYRREIDAQIQEEADLESGR